MTGPTINTALAVIVDADELERLVRATVREELQTSGAVKALPEWFGSAAEVAAYLGIGESTVEKLTAARKLPAEKIGKRNVWHRLKVDEALLSGALK
jgi:excisionase family DNA binding protein